ncbi:cytochrome b561 [Escherichia coli]|uniref:Cytochrome b561 n=1 Tax=Escherichia coli TaxID=562 RepID=A0A376KUK7_ECOLX|nr:cytochrome b561 [Escherichia coli]
MENKYSRLQISIPLAGLFAGYRSVLRNGVSWFLPHVAIGHSSNMVHVSCGISILVLMVVRLLLRLKIPNPADYT